MELAKLEFENWEFEDLEFENSEFENLELNIENVFELYASRQTTFVFDVQLYLAYLILSLGWVVRKSDFKENPKSDLDLDLGFVKIVRIKISKFCSFVPSVSLTEISHAMNFK